MRVNISTQWDISADENNFLNQIQGKISSIFDSKTKGIVIHSVRFDTSYDNLIIILDGFVLDKKDKFIEVSYHLHCNKQYLNLILNREMKSKEEFLADYLTKAREFINKKVLFGVKAENYTYTGKHISPTMLKDFDNRFLLLHAHKDTNSIKEFLKASIKLDNYTEDFFKYLKESKEFSTSVFERFENLNILKDLEKLGLRKMRSPLNAGMAVLGKEFTNKGVSYTIAFHPLFVTVTDNSKGHTIYFFVRNSKLGRTELNSIKKYVNYVCTLISIGLTNEQHKELEKIMANMGKAYRGLF